MGTCPLPAELRSCGVTCVSAKITRYRSASGPIIAGATEGRILFVSLLFRIRTLFYESRDDTVTQISSNMKRDTRLGCALAGHRP